MTRWSRIRSFVVVAAAVLAMLTVATAPAVGKPGRPGDRAGGDRARVAVEVSGCTVTATYTWRNLPGVYGADIEMVPAPDSAPFPCGGDRVTYATPQRTGEYRYSRTFTEPVHGLVHASVVHESGMTAYGREAPFAVTECGS